MAPDIRPLIQLRDVWKVYHLGDVEVRALRGVSLDIRAGEFLAIVGASGSGKSTCMNLLGRLHQPTRGTYHLGDADVSTLSVDERAAIRSRRIGFIFQNFNLLGRSTALENVALPMIYANVPFAEQRRRARELLAAVGLRGREHHLPSQLSGGQQQRVAIARALANGPSMLLADEPTGNLDTQSSAEIMDLFLRLRREQRITIVLVTHETDIADYTERIITFRDGRMVADAPAVTRDCPAVADLTWMKRQLVQVVYGNQNWSTSAQGVTPAYPQVRSWPVAAGRFFDAKDEAGAVPVALLGQTVVDHLFEPGEDPIGTVIRVKN